MSFPATPFHWNADLHMLKSPYPSQTIRHCDTCTGVQVCVVELGCERALDPGQLRRRRSSSIRELGLSLRRNLTRGHGSSVIHRAATNVDTESLAVSIMENVSQINPTPPPTTVTLAWERLSASYNTACPALNGLIATVVF